MRQNRFKKDGIKSIKGNFMKKKKGKKGKKGNFMKIELKLL